MLLAAFTASTALASPLLKVRQNNDDEDNTLFSPLNNTQITPGGTLNFTYRVDDDDARAVRVALVQIIEIARDLPTTRGSDGNGLVTAEIALPANLTAGNYLIAVSELDDDDDRDDEDGQYDSWDFEFHAPGEDDDDERRRYVTVANTTAA